MTLLAKKQAFCSAAVVLMVKAQEGLLSKPVSDCPFAFPKSHQTKAKHMAPILPRTFALPPVYP